jgi:uncharacterized delta-60 repeat protein
MRTTLIALVAIWTMSGCDSGGTKRDAGVDADGIAHDAEDAGEETQPDGDGGGIGDTDGGDANDAGDTGGGDWFRPDIDELDPDFGHGGLQTVGNHLSGTGALWDVEVQDDGKLVAFGRNYEGMVLVRVTSSGELDPEFGTGGFAWAPYGRPVNGFYYGLGEMEVAANGDLVVAGHIHPIGNSYQRTAVARFDESGLLDPTFADNGFYSPDPLNLTSAATCVELQSTGNIVVGLQDGGSKIVRFTPDGILDTGFGDNGQVLVSYGGQAADVIGLATRTDDRILLTGQSYSDSAYVALGALTADGDVDETFGDGAGHVVDSAPGTRQPTGYAIDLAPDGMILLAAARPVVGDEGSSQFAVGRFGADGTVDASFGTDGWITEADTGGRAFDVVVQSDNKVVAVGSAIWPGGQVGRVVRFGADGALDETFGNGGVVENTLVDALGVSLQPDGKIVTVGTNGFNRYLTDGSPDTAFGVDGHAAVATGHSIERAMAVAVQEDGGILVGGAISIVGGGGLVRLTADGEVDTTFGGSSQIRPVAPLMTAVTPWVIRFDSQGRILVGGQAWNVPGFRMARLSAEGVEDASFGLNGFEAGALVGADQVVTGNMAYLDDDNIFLGGFLVFDGAIHLGVLKIDSSGIADTAFGDEGLASVRLTAPVLVEANMLMEVLPGGEILVAALSSLYKFAPDGQLDAGFGDAGVLPVSASAMVVQGGFLYLWNGSSGLARYGLDGLLDAGFGTGGFVGEDLGIGPGSPVALSVASDGTILFGASNSDMWREDAVVFRYHADGTRDTGFGQEGRLDMPLSEHSSALHAVILDSSGRAIFAGRAWTAEGGSDFAVVRFE